MEYYQYNTIAICSKAISYRNEIAIYIVYKLTNPRADISISC